MARRVFFSFHYENDIWRVNQVRNTWVTKEDIEEAGYIDAADFEKLKKQGDEAIERWINKQLEGTSVTVVLIGAETSGRKWVRHEITESHKRGNGILGIYIHNLKDNSGIKGKKGSNQFGEIGKDENDKPIYFWQIYETYDWINDNGYDNFSDWIEKAAEDAGR